MPIYQYKNLECNDCPEYLDIYHGINEVKENAVCEKCGKEVKVTKVFSITPVHFKGSGFYVNDYRKADDGMKKYLPRDPNTKRVY
jgi:putative FmdB family regulatory protein